MNSREPIVYEVLGLAGSGKSTLIKLLEKNKYLSFNIQKKIGLYLIPKMPLACYIYYRTKNNIYFKAYLQFYTYLKYFQVHKSIDKKIILDQGPIYLISILIKEVPELKNFFLNDLKKILPYYNSIIYLTAPVTILIERINSREQAHRIKNIDKVDQESFLEEYRKIFDYILQIAQQHHIQVKIIDTNKHSINDVERLVNGIIQK